MSAPTKENALALAAVDIDGKHTWEKSQITVSAVLTGPQQVQRLALPSICGSLGKAVEGNDSRQGKGHQWLRSQENFYYCFCVLICAIITGLGRSPGEGNGNPLQYSCLEKPMDRGAWQATVNGVTKSRTRLSDFTFTLAIFEISLVSAVVIAVFFLI